MRIGLYGGSFNPIHAGHLLVMEETLRRLQLDALWVLVTPGNPLKPRTGLAPLDARVLAARAAVSDPRIRVTGFEAAHGFVYTWQTLTFLRASLPAGASSGSWAPTASPISIAGNAGRTSP